MADGFGHGRLEARETAARVRVEELREEVKQVLGELRDTEVLLERRVMALAAPELEVEEPVPPVSIVWKVPVEASIETHSSAGSIAPS